jgi:ribA/ribD-fused uncharacterized protein
MIKEFKEEYSWLSNFSPCKIILNDIEYPSVEHAYVSCKSSDEEWKKLCSDDNNSPGKIKRKGREIKIVDNWEDIKEDVMFECLLQKYSQEPYKTKLIETGNQKIIEGNNWNDKFWGVCLKTNKGKNKLGKMIMIIRSKLNKKDLKNFLK